MAFFSLRLVLCGHRKFRRNRSTWRREASTSRLPTFMLGPETVTQLMGRLAPRTTTQHPHTRRVMCPRDRYTEHRHFMKDIAPCTRRGRPTLTSQSTPTRMQKSFRRGRPLPCHTTAMRIVYSVRLMVGIVTNSCYKKGQLGDDARRHFCVEVAFHGVSAAVGATNKVATIGEPSAWGTN